MDMLNVVDGRTKPGERVLNAVSIECVDVMRKRVPEIGTAESTIRTALLAEDLVAYRNKKRIAVDELTPEELSLLRYSMPEMCGAAIGYIHDVGVVPIAIEEGAFPYVPSPELGRITVYVENGRKRYRWWKRRERKLASRKRKRGMETDTFNALVAQLHLDMDTDDTEAFGSLSSASLAGFDPDPSVVVLSGFGYDPRADGTLESVLVSLIHVYAEKTRRDYLDNEAATGLAKPVLWYARPDALSGTLNSNAPIDLNVPENMFVNTDASSANTNDRIAQNEQELVQLNMHIEQFLRVEKERGIANKPGNARRVKLAEELLDALRRLLPLPTGATFASGVQQPRLSGEQKLRDDQFKEQVLTVLNVPLELINPMATHRAGVEEVTNRFRSTTLRQWQRWLERILTFAYRMSFKTRAEETILGKIDTDAMTSPENQLLKTCNEQCVTIGFVIEERATYEQLKELAYLRVIDQKHYSEHVCRILHIDTRDLSDKTESEKEFYAKLDTFFVKPVAQGAQKPVPAPTANAAGAGETKSSKEVTASSQK